MRARLVLLGPLALAICAMSVAQTLSEKAPTAEARNAPAGSAEFEVYCDFRCPFCARLFSTLLAGAKAEDREVAFHFKHFPFHEGATALARFYEATVVNYPDQREALIDSLYRFRRQTVPENLPKMIPSLSLVHGLDFRRIDRDMKARDIDLAIADSERAAVAAGVEATPTVFYGGAPVTLEEPEQLARFMLDHSPRRSQPGSADDCPVCARPRSWK